jgi:hypothetical protein
MVFKHHYSGIKKDTQIGGCPPLFKKDHKKSDRMTTFLQDRIVKKNKLFLTS